MIHLRENDLAKRWCLSLRTLQRWRIEGQGPPHLKLGGRVVYRLSDVEAYEREQLRQGSRHGRS